MTIKPENLYIKKLVITLSHSQMKMRHYDTGHNNKRDVRFCTSRAGVRFQILVQLCPDLYKCPALQISAEPDLYRRDRRQYLGIKRKQFQIHWTGKRQRNLDGNKILALYIFQIIFVKLHSKFQRLNTVKAYSKIQVPSYPPPSSPSFWYFIRLHSGLCSHLDSHSQLFKLATSSYSQIHSLLLRLDIIERKVQMINITLMLQRTSPLGNTRTYKLGWIIDCYYYSIIIIL